MNSKVFSERFNRELTLLDLPEEPTDKVKAVSKVFGISRHLANALILGHLVPSETQLQQISEILEVCPKWLAGHSDKKKAYARREDTETTE